MTIYLQNHNCVTGDKNEGVIVDCKKVALSFKIEFILGKLRKAGTQVYSPV